MDEIKITRRKLPPDASSGPRARYALAIVALKPEQSFTAPYEDRALLAVHCTNYGRRLGRKYVTRRLGGLVLVYRVA